MNLACKQTLHILQYQSFLVSWIEQYFFYFVHRYYLTIYVEYNFYKLNHHFIYLEQLSYFYKLLLKQMKIHIKLEYISKELIRFHIHQNYAPQIARLLEKLNLKWVPEGAYYCITPQNIKQLHKIVQQYNHEQKANKGDFKKIVIQDIPQKIHKMITQAINRVKKDDEKLMILDPLMTQRYSFVLSKLNKMEFGKGSSRLKAIIICPQIFKKQWINTFRNYDIQDFKTHLIFRPVQILTFERILTLAGSLKKFTPDYIVCDFAEALVNCDNFTFSLISELLKSINKVHFFVCHWMTGSIKSLFTLLYTLKSEFFNEESWFHKRYSNGNLQELKYILDHTVLYRLGNHYQGIKCYNNMVQLSAPQTYQAQATGIPYGSKLTLLTLNAKLLSLQSYISFMEKWVSRIVLVTSLDLIEKKIIGFLIDNQSLYCTHQSIDQFNRKSKQKILVLNISKMISKLQKTFNCSAKTITEEIVPRIYGAKFFLFCDCPWNYTQYQQRFIEMLLSKSQRSYVKKYIILSQSYEKELCQNFLHDLQNNKQNQCYVPPQSKMNPLFEKMARKDQIINQQFTDYPSIEGVYDIDEQFDKLEFEVLKINEQQKNETSKPIYKMQEEQFALENQTKTTSMKEIFIDDSLTMYEPQTVSTEETYGNKRHKKISSKQIIGESSQNECLMFEQTSKKRVYGKLSVRLIENKSIYSLI